MPIKKVILSLLPIVLIGSWFYVTRQDQVVTPRVHNVEPASNTTEAESEDFSNAAQIVVVDPNTTTDPSTSTSLSNEQVTSQAVNDYQSDLLAIRYDSLSDADFKRYTSQLKSDRQFLSAMLTELRESIDLTHGKRLSALLSRVDDPKIIQVATELAYSGNKLSQIIGLDLLNRVQTTSAEARDISIQLLGTETDPEILVAAMNVIATATSNASNSQIEQISDNLFLLSNHAHPSVRAQSLSVLGQWRQNSPEVTQALSEALQDPDPLVRTRAVYALNNRAPLQTRDIERLFIIMETTTEERSTREAAMLNLQGRNLQGAQLRRFANAQKKLRTRSTTN